jgi:His/Glu/Gln/Arg/opine family amino acid ABC transporter permease subunit
MAASAVSTAADARRRWRLLAWLALGALVVAAAYVLAAFVIDWPDWAEPVARYIITVGLPATLRVAAAAVVGSTVIGIVLGTLLTIKWTPSRVLIRLYIEVFRGLPILVTVFIVWFGFPAVTPTLKFGPLTATAIALILWGSAQVAEATRGAVQSIPREQHEAASALGFGWVGAHSFVILPQALRRLLPPLVGLLVNIIQNSTLAAAIGGIEILGASRSQVERLTFFPPAGIGEIHAFEIFTGVMVLFFLISFPLTRLAAYLEKRLV